MKLPDIDRCAPVYQNQANTCAEELDAVRGDLILDRGRGDWQLCTAAGYWPTVHLVSAPGVLVCGNCANHETGDLLYLRSVSQAVGLRQHSRTALNHCSSDDSISRRLSGCSYLACDAGAAKLSTGSAPDRLAAVAGSGGKLPIFLCVCLQTHDLRQPSETAGCGAR